MRSEAITHSTTHGYRRLFSRRRVKLVCAVFASLLTTAGCGSVSPSEGTAVDSTAAGEISSGETGEKDPFGMIFEGGAAWSGGKVSAGSPAGMKNTALLQPEADNYRIAFTLTAEPGLTGAVYFLAADRDNGYRLSFNTSKHKATLGQMHRGDIAGSTATACDIKEGEPFRVTLDVGRDSVRVAFGNDPDDPDLMRFDVVRKDGAPNSVIFDCGSSGDVVFSDISLSDLPEYSGPVYENPILDPAKESADPFILCDSGRYYLYSTSAPMEGYRVWVSDDLTHWTERGFCLVNADVYGEPTLTAGFWAPEVYAVERGGKNGYALLYTVNERVGIAFADSPEGPFKSESDSYLVTDSRAIDPTIFTDDDGKTYLFYVGFGEKEYGIYGCEVNLDTLACGPAKQIIKPEAKWETKESKVTEGPFMLKHEGVYYLTYSGNGYTSHYYAVGYATSDSPLGDFERCELSPVLAQCPANGVYGPGHHAFFYSPGGRLMIVYHRHA
ncbi:MAG: glycoside hydrolase family 43 protein, partial [Clostridia bacterium]|nr:glycoside hydrolase family 43 protein [Clostridia bacterium]